LKGDIKDLRVIIVKNLKNEAFSSLIIANVKPGTKAIKDNWLSYMGLEDLR